MTLRPLGRVAPAVVQRFADKYPAEIVRQTLDISDWLAEQTADSFASASAAAYPTGATISAVAQASGVLSWTFASGTAGNDYLVVITYTAASGRVGMQLWQCLVNDPTGTIASPSTTSVAALFAAYLATLPTSYVGLSAGQGWNNGGVFSIA